MINGEKVVIIIPAAGLGTRLMPITQCMPKALIDVAGKPAICHILEHLQSFVDEVRIVIRRPHYQMFQTFLGKRKYPFILRYFYQEVPTGPLDAIAEAVGLEDTEVWGTRLLIWLSDTIMRGETIQLPSDECVVWTSEVPDYKRWCLIDKNGIIYDKPFVDPQTRQALIGIYYFRDFAYAAKAIQSRTGCEISDLLRVYDKVIPIETKNWLDTGEIETLLDTRSKLLNSREDNSIRIDFFEGKVIKTGPRVENESFWYNQILPTPAEKFIPRVYSASANKVELEYVPAKTIQQIFTYEDCHKDMISFILKSALHKYQMAFSDTQIDDNVSVYMFYDKAKSRLKEIAKYEFIDKEEIKELEDFLDSDEYQQMLKSHLGRSQIIHGDFHFGNILFDINSNKMWMIDPRGNWDNKCSIYGAAAYDYAKFYQSACCEYMWVINNAETDVALRDTIVSVLDQYFGSAGTFYKYVACILQMTCLPFHKDSELRQWRLWRTAFNCFRRLQGKEEL